MLFSNLLERKMSDEEIKAMTNALVINLAPLVHQQKNEKNYQEEIE